MRSTIALAALAALSLFAAAPARASDLPAPVEQALLDALADEHHAEAVYAAVIDKFGPVRPFVNIIEAERRHAEFLTAVMESHGMAIKDNPLIGSKEIAAAVPATRAEACKLGYDAEIANRDLYDGKLIPAANGHADVIAVFERLRDASENNHLRAFERCAGR